MNIILQCNIILAILCQFCFANNEEDLTVAQLKIQVEQLESKIYIITDNLENDVAKHLKYIKHLELQNGKKDRTILSLQNEVANLKTIQENELNMAGKETFNQFSN
jgi:uncharacterized pyridoxamine 5'-phosphate oxidase family protein